jgi:hypothetical protein
MDDKDHGAPRGRGTILRVLLAVVAAGAIALAMRNSGFSAVLTSLQRVAPLLPVIAGIEAFRIYLEVVATRAQLLPNARVRTAELCRIQLTAYGICILSPAGRPVSEAAKAALLAPSIGRARAASIAIRNQALSLVADATLSLIALLGLLVIGARAWLTTALAVHTAVCLGAALAIEFAAQSRLAERVARRLFGRNGAPLCAERVPRARLALPLAAFVLSKALVVAALLLLLYGSGASLQGKSVFFALGMNAIAAVLGDLVPAQIGTTDAAFALVAGELGSSLLTVLIATTTFHLVQLSWVCVANVAPLFWRSAARLERALPAEAGSPF